MKSVLINTAEFESRRFEDLCERLDMDNTVDQRIAILGHLTRWQLRWASDETLDSGLLWDVTEKRMGMWAEWSKTNPLQFGRALVQAGYCAPVNDVFPEQLCGGRNGFVVVGALDRSWHIHKQRADRNRLVLYLIDPVRRARQCANLGVSPADAPQGWIMDEDQIAACEAGGIYGAGGDTLRRSYEGTTKELRRDFEASSKELRSGYESPLSDVNVNVKERRNVIPRNVENVDGNGTGRRTGKKKCGDMLWFVRDNRYENPLAALCAMDDSERARILWTRAVEEDVSAVQTILAEMTETDESWAKIGNPAAVATARIKKMIPGMGKRYGNGNGNGLRGDS